MPRESTTLKMRLLDKTPGAVKVTDSTRPAVSSGQALFFHWLPRSLIGYSRTVPQAAGELPVFVFTLPDWKVEELGLGKFETSER